MASTGGFSSLVFLSLAIVFLFSSRTLAQTPLAPAPAPSGPVNLTGILEKGGQFTTFIRLLNTTQVDRQLINQLNSSTEGMTVFAPTDNAFNSLPSGAINDLSPQEKVQLVLYHITSKYYSLSDLLLVSNPVRTLASGEDGNWGLNFTGQGNQLNVSTGVVETQLNNALRQQFPLAVYQVEKVLLPEQLFGAKAPSATPTPKTSPSGASNTTESSADQPAPADSDAGARSMGLGLVTGLAVLFCMEVFS